MKLAAADNKIIHHDRANHDWGFNDDAVTKLREVVRGKFAERMLTGLRTIENVHTSEGWGKLLASRVGAGDKRFVRDFEAEFPAALPLPLTACQPKDIWDFHFTDYGLAPWEEAMGENREGQWLRWHGTNVYAAFNSLALNYVGASEKAAKQHEITQGRGIYTTERFGKAQQYAMPWVLSELAGKGPLHPKYKFPGHMEFVLLLRVPGEAKGAQPLGMWTLKSSGKNRNLLQDFEKLGLGNDPRKFRGSGIEGVG